MGMLCEKTGIGGPHVRARWEEEETDGVGSRCRVPRGRWAGGAVRCESAVWGWDVISVE